MASKNTCRVCLHALKSVRTSPHSSFRNQTIRTLYVPSKPHLSLPQKPEPKPSDPVTRIPLPGATPPDASFNIPNPSATEAGLSEEARVRLARELRKRATAATETYVAYGATEILFKECSRQADYDIPLARQGEYESVQKTDEGEDLGVAVTLSAVPTAGEGTSWWLDALALPPTFSTWSQISLLHMYILTTRLRHFPASHAPAWHQHLIDHFFYAAEHKMATLHNMHSASIRGRYLKDLFIQWRGLLAAYDEGLVKGDSILAAAIWRNVLKGRQEWVARGTELAAITGWVRREVSRLAGLEDEAVANGSFKFGSPREEAEVVEEESPRMREPFAEEMP